MGRDGKTPRDVIYHDFRIGNHGRRNTLWTLAQIKTDEHPAAAVCRERLARRKGHGTLKDLRRGGETWWRWEQDVPGHRQRTHLYVIYINVTTVSLLREEMAKRNEKHILSAIIVIPSLIFYISLTEIMIPE